MSITFSMTGTDLSAALRHLVETDVTAAAQRRSEADEASPAATVQAVVGKETTETAEARPTSKREGGQ